MEGKYLHTPKSLTINAISRAILSCLCGGKWLTHWATSGWHLFYLFTIIIIFAKKEILETQPTKPSTTEATQQSQDETDRNKKNQAITERGCRWPSTKQNNQKHLRSQEDEASEIFRRCPNQNLPAMTTEGFLRRKHPLMEKETLNCILWLNVNLECTAHELLVERLENGNHCTTHLSLMINYLIADWSPVEFSFPLSKFC